MAPKKKGNKKGNDNWEADLGEAPDPIAAAAQEAKDGEAAQDAESDEAPGGGGGLLAALKKNKSNKKKKGKVVEEDYVEGEDPPAADDINGHVEPSGIQDLASKAPEEATTEDLFEEQVTKAKGGKGRQGKKDGTLVPNDDGDGEDADEGGTGGVKSKKEKEKEKKEREKARKKEQVCAYLSCRLGKCRDTKRRKLTDMLVVSRPLRRRNKEVHSLHKKRSLLSLYSKRSPRLHQLPMQ